MNGVATYRYLRPSTLTDQYLTLQTSGGPAANPRFFAGFLTRPVPAAAGLLAVTEVARTRYHRPVDPASLDPVVTADQDQLRFESFSGCCGVYARLDIGPRSPIRTSSPRRRPRCSAARTPTRWRWNGSSMAWCRRPPLIARPWSPR
ncbi:hypothetical protein O7632_20545 [Solwaraspora sp. WMMD406]|uniref:hypothetical protein n=1 Tax=Solwaraspora sp. WMMD406 TaxID=3016095 RepID=UPI00241784B2|nr:hypothetical protein [Solwaraspora sp. WMMD406]MDG4766471.1 hypothetical protein [Solwaraspora sp. WMMD406]